MACSFSYSEVMRILSVGRFRKECLREKMKHIHTHTHTHTHIKEEIKLSGKHYRYFLNNSFNEF